MAVAVSFSVEGIADLRKDLERLTDKAFSDDVVGHAVEDGARLIGRRARQIVPVDRGVLRDSIHEARTRSDPTAWRITMGGPGAAHANLIELGMPNRGIAAEAPLRKASDQERHRAVARVRRRLEQTIKGATR